MNETHQARAPTVPRTGRPNREPLDADEVIAYAIALARDLAPRFQNANGYIGC